MSKFEFTKKRVKKLIFNLKFYFHYLFFLEIFSIFEVELDDDINNFDTFEDLVKLKNKLNNSIYD